MFEKTAELYDLFYDWKDYPAEAARLASIVAEVNPAAKTLLDVACGTGRHLEHLREQYLVEGADVDAGLLHVAAERLPEVPLHHADMLELRLERRFDVVTCLFSSIGYVRTVENLRRAVARMASHLAPGGILLVEPWITPDAFDPNHLGRVIVGERPELQAVRANGARVDGSLSILDFHYLVVRPGSVEHLVETHELGLFTADEYRGALEDAGLRARHDPVGLMGRGLWIGRAPAAETARARGSTMSPPS